ncbi:uncharacterized protein LOC117921352 isoform X1 [Vitis riparia]|uniref:uncharacterized protein LOC117921352 isoform X1 n=1 Tax=Vitis riparia TaxID=96939 RepID=UPI00155A2B30|nr:uncharacterized protein LOC117921352 isoform X1 [Vitis riparia]XP_034695114.1 uncharacterized protein LOC117921352 isoform X1 [Vitis riparia]
MELFESSLPLCPRHQHCSLWAWRFMKFCLCSVKDEISLTLGVISVISWAIAEIPQIITNYKEKSSEGLSIAFLMTWIVGDLFNVLGCFLEPATLPTQFYMAVLYTITTLILAAQSIYYGHIYHRLKSSRWYHKEIKPNQTGTINKNREDNNSAGGRQVSDGLKNESNVFGEVPLSSPIPVNLPASPRNISPSRELYYMSARSLSKSHAPAMGSFLAQRKTSPSVHDSNSLEEPLLSSVVLSQSAPASTTKSMLSMLSATMFFLGCFNFLPSENNRDDIVAEKPNQGGIALKVGRTLLQLSEGGGNSGIGTFLGWSMTAIYLGGRLPQIILNIRRGTIEGLNPLMFLFALTGNATYVGSILVSSLDWSKIKPNLPWLVDAGGCVLLDAFILTQFIYFHSRTPEDQENKDGNFNAA